MWTRFSAVESAKIQHLHSVEDIVTGQRTRERVARIISHADKSLFITEELHDVFITLKNQKEAQMEAIRAVVLGAGSDDRAIQR